MLFVPPIYFFLVFLKLDAENLEMEKSSSCSKCKSPGCFTEKKPQQKWKGLFLQRLSYFNELHKL